MRRIRLSIVTVVALVAGLVTTVPATGSTPPAPTYYLAVGDSLAFGFPPDAEHKFGYGYADILYGKLSRSDPALQLVKIGCPGETTESMLDGPPAQEFCAAFNGGAGSQLLAAEAFMKEHGAAVTYLTIDIGANDILHCITGIVIDEACVRAGLSDVAKNLPTILQGLRDVAAPSTKTAGMTYYDPYTALWPQSQETAKQSVLIVDALNVLEAVNYFRYGFRVAPVGIAFHNNDFRPSTPPSERPENGQTACELTLMCPKDGSKPDIHPNRNGYTVIANTFALALGVH